MAMSRFVTKSASILNKCKFYKQIKSSILPSSIFNTKEHCSQQEGKKKRLKIDIQQKELSLIIIASFWIFIIDISMSKQETIKRVEQQLDQPETYLFRTLQQQLLKDGVSKDHQLIKTLDILATQTVATCQQKNIKIQTRYAKKLKMMTILSSFFGATVYSLIKLEHQLDSKRQEVLDLLTEASIFKLVSIKIDEQQDQIKILRSNIRQRQSISKGQQYTKGRLIQIKQNNNSLEREINNILGLLGEKSKEEVSPKRERGYLGSLGMGF